MPLWRDCCCTKHGLECPPLPPAPVSLLQSLAYMHAAAAVRTCAYKLVPPVRPEQLPLVGGRHWAGSGHGWGMCCTLPATCRAAGCHALEAPLQSDTTTARLPQVGDFTAGIITEILETGTCAQLEQFRCTAIGLDGWQCAQGPTWRRSKLPLCSLHRKQYNLLLANPCRRDEPVRDSKGGVRADSAGAATRRAFTKLPGVGAKVAQQWWDRGLRWVGWGKAIEGSGAALILG